MSKKTRRAIALIALLTLVTAMPALIKLIIVVPLLMALGIDFDSFIVDSEPMKGGVK